MIIEVDDENEKFYGNDHHNDFEDYDDNVISE
eukprot:CAMPEP_0168347600 /NCGR_PEP_ID=MMETSP0213-20121227/19111_1 /TAXON_ID=151035 /ORGANISM="Euplotes harpa, Strain FSP1.4" /LENGTH=31 /DNA_ID= /DNA_START= /DNA_END= /DNA_ORIENTATION=